MTPKGRPIPIPGVERHPDVDVVDTPRVPGDMPPLPSDRLLDAYERMAVAAERIASALECIYAQGTEGD